MSKLSLRIADLRKKKQLTLLRYSGSPYPGRLHGNNENCPSENSG